MVLRRRSVDCRFLTGETRLEALRQGGKMHWMLLRFRCPEDGTKNLEGSSGWKRGNAAARCPCRADGSPRNPLSDPCAPLPFVGVIFQGRPPLVLFDKPFHRPLRFATQHHLVRLRTVGG
jgi:hypothetical protein